MENTSTQTEQTSSTETTTSEAGNLQPNSGEWFLAEGVQGTGEKPEYYLDKKYSSLAEQASAYPELQQKFGSFSGAPDEYSVSEGTELDGEHPLLERIQSFGKENDLSQEGYQKLVDTLLDNERSFVADQQAQEAQVLKDLGVNANERLQNIDDFVGANMEANDSMKDLISLAKKQPGGVELLESFINMGKKTAPASEQVVAPIKTYNKDELHKMQFAKDEYGNRKMNDTAYKKQVEAYSAKLIAQG